MITVNSRPVILLKDLKAMCNSVGDHSYDNVFENLIDSILKQPENTAARRILALFNGGMGSFNDFVLHKDGKVIADLMGTFDNERSKLYNWAIHRL